jgi:hypothetical protein
MAMNAGLEAINLYRGRSGLTAAELGGLLAGQPQPVVWLGLARSGDAPSRYRLELWLYLQAIDLATAMRWRLERGREQVRTLTQLALERVLTGARCTKRALAARMGLSRAESWVDTWEPRYRALVALLVCLEGELLRAMRRGVRG